MCGEVFGAADMFNDVGGAVVVPGQERLGLAVGTSRLYGPSSRGALVEQPGDGFAGEQGHVAGDEQPGRRGVPAHGGSHAGQWANAVGGIGEMRV